MSDKILNSLKASSWPSRLDHARNAYATILCANNNDHKQRDITVLYRRWFTPASGPPLGTWA